MTKSILFKTTGIEKNLLIRERLDKARKLKFDLFRILSPLSRAIALLHFRNLQPVQISLSGVIGNSLTRLLVALKIALATAAATPMIETSPMPLTPNLLNTRRWRTLMNADYR